MTRMKRVWPCGVSSVVLAAAMWLGHSTGAEPPAAGEPEGIESGVRLVLDSDELDPTTTFEVRFDEAMVARDQVGTDASASPLVLQPAVKGTFTWLSRRSGVFTPDEAPRLGTTYRATLRAGLKLADGAGSTARLDRQLVSPPFGVMHFRHTDFNTNDTISIPRIGVMFNAAVVPAAVAKATAFVDETGRRVDAQVTQVLSNDTQFGEMEKSWQQRFDTRDEGEDEEENGDHEESATVSTNAAPVLHAVWIAPRQPLPLATGWRLVLNAGLPAAEGGLATVEEHVVDIGTVRPFEVASIDTLNGVTEGKRVSVEFTKELHPDLQASNAWEFVSVSDAPTNLTVSVNTRSLELAGAFVLSNRYTVTVKSGVRAREPFTLKAGVSNDVMFEPLPPRIYLPAFDATQLASGRRTIDVLVRNVSKVRVRLKQLTADNIVDALRQYASHEKRSNEPDADDEPYREVDFDGMPGVTRGGASFDGFDQRDEAKRHTLSWDTLLKGQSNAAVFLAVESMDGVSGDYHRPLLGAQALVQITDLGVLWKRSKSGEAWVHVFSLKTGQPVAGARLQVRTAENGIVELDDTHRTEAVTDREGRAHFSRVTQGDWLVVSTDGDLLAAAFGWNDGGLGTYAVDGHVPVSWWSDGSETTRMMLFTERGVYRPGETAHVKGVCRRIETNRFTTPAGDAVSLLVRDAKGRELLSKTLTLSTNGTIDADVAIPANAPLGGCYARLEWGKATAGASFTVQEYHPNTFEVRHAVEPDPAPGTPLTLGLHAAYLMGKPLYRAKVEWSLTGGDAGFSPEGYRGFVFCGEAVEERRQLELQRGNVSLQGEGEVAKDGAFRIEPTLGLNPKVPQPRGGSILFEITDLNQQTISERVEFTKHSSSFYLGLRGVDGLLRAGEPLAPEIIAVANDNAPWTNAVKATATLHRVTFDSVRVQTAGGSIAYENRLKLIPAGTANVAVMPLKRYGHWWDTVSAPAAVPGLTPAVAGTYLLEVRTKDGAGRDVVTWGRLEVEGKDADAWAYEQDTSLDVIRDRDEYAPGDTARLMVKSPFDGQALVTVERERVLRSFTVNLTGRATVIDVPLTAEDAPNVFVSVTLLRGAAASPRKFKLPQFRTGMCPLVVKDAGTRLEVDVKTAAPHYEPGREVSATATVRGADGKPVSDAEVTLYAVDEGVLSLTGYVTPDPLAELAFTIPLAVRGDITLPSLMEEDRGHLGFGNKGYLIGGGGEEEGAAEVRKNFIACAFWSATLTTDAEGRATAKFTAPDALTRYRVMAVVVHRAQRFGSGEGSFEVKKPVMLEPALPRFANITDRMTLRAVVHNESGRDASVDVSLKLDDKATGNGPLLKTVPVASGASAVVEFPVTFVATGEAKWTWRAAQTGSTNAYADAVQTTLKVGHVAPVLTEVLLGRVLTGATNLVKEANPQMLEGQGAMEVNVANSRVAEVNEAVRHLLDYPYGCVEQTASRLLPWIALRGREALFPQLKRTPSDVATVVQDNVTHLLAMQTPGGGLSYWPGGEEPMLWASAYGGFALALARKQGFDVPADALDRLCTWMTRELEGTADLRDNDELSDRALAALALATAGRPATAVNEALFAKRNRLSAETRAVLGLALTASGAPLAQAAELLKLPKGLPGQDDLWFGCAARETAARLLLAIRVDPSAKLIDTLMAELLEGRKQGHWSTTQGNAWAMLAFGDYAERVEGRPRPVSGSLAFDQARQAFALTPELPSAAAVFETLPAAPDTALTLTTDGKSPLYTRVRLTSRAVVPKQPRQDRGFSVQRTYAVMQDDNTAAPLGTPRVGDRILVTVQVEVRVSAHFVAIDDPLPANFEAVNPEFDSQQTSADAAAGMDWVSDFSELREDRALFFCDHLPPGRHTLRYLARVRAAGTATAPQTKVEEMYRPEHFGLGESVEVVSLPWE